MIVVADASPLNYLVLIDQIGLLPILYQQVLIPEAVLAELRRPRAPKSVGLWIASPAASNGVGWWPGSVEDTR
jgi:predicted nucleic acid-binding protein